MAKEKLLPRETLAKNLKGLMAETKLSAPEIARMAGVDRKTVNNQLNGRFDPRPEALDAVAKVFNLAGWELLSPNFDMKAAKNTALQKLIELFNASDEKGREAIMNIAELAAAKRK
jgi:transcriptional regulator with XRE-family HTH domain